MDSQIHNASAVGKRRLLAPGAGDRHILRVQYIFQAVISLGISVSSKIVSIHANFICFVRQNDGIGEGRLCKYIGTAIRLLNAMEAGIRPQAAAQHQHFSTILI